MFPPRFKKIRDTTRADYHACMHLIFHISVKSQHRTGWTKDPPSGMDVFGEGCQSTKMRGTA